MEATLVIILGTCLFAPVDVNAGASRINETPQSDQVLRFQAWKSKAAPISMIEEDPQYFELPNSIIEEYPLYFKSLSSMTEEFPQDAEESYLNTREDQDVEVPCSINKGEKQDFQNCTGSDPDTRWRRCCTSNLLPYGCECFDTSSESYFNHKLFKLPECPDDIPMEFTIYNNREFLEGVPIAASALLDHHEHTTLKTLFLVHGYTDSADITWMNALRKELLMMYDCNVVLVDWEIGAKYPYRQAVANIRTVAAMMGQLISKMAAQWDLRLDNVHLIGHSLGAHVMGLTGQEVLRLTGKRVGRISGLDPAGPGFWTAADLVILDKTDASFVDVIHTNGRKLGEGMARSIGHADFWPNGGASQPGCGSMDNSCSHHRAHDLYQASVLGLCEFHAVNEQRAVCMMGYHANATCSGVFDAAEFTTQTYFPFC